MTSEEASPTPKTEEGRELTKSTSFEPYPGPVGGWGSLRSVASHLFREEVPVGKDLVLWKQNKADGFMCVSCAWAKPRDPYPFEFCENGAKATAWEITSERIGREFFAQHTCTELESWSDFDLEKEGRLTEPLRWDPETDKYVPVLWTEAFRDIGARLKACDPKKTVFYTSRRASLETSYMFQLFARLYGHNNLPDSSNMCHWASRKASAQGSGPGRWRISNTAISSFTSARTPARTVRASCMNSSMQGSAGRSSLCSIRCASAGWNGSRTRKTPSRC